MALSADTAGIRTLVVLCFVSSVSAAPLSITPLVASEPSPTPVILTLSLCTPFVVLAALKFTYLRYRRAQSIHTDAVAGPSLAECTETKASRMLGLGFDASVLYPSVKRKLRLRADASALAGYIVGCFGSPEWETTMRVRVDAAARRHRPESSFIQSQSQAASPMLSASVWWSSRGSRTTTGGNRTSVSASRYSSSRSRSMSVSFLDMHSPNTNTNSSHADAHSRDGITDCSTVHPSSPPCIDFRNGHGALLPVVPSEASRPRTKSGSMNSRRHASTSTLSPTLMQVMEPVIAAWRHDSPKDKSSSSDSSNSHGRSPTMTPAFETPPTSPNMHSSPSSAGSAATARLTISVSGKQLSTMATPILGRAQSLSASVHSGNLSVPAPTYSPDMSYKQPETKRAPSSTAQTKTRSPLSPTSRTLNIQVDRSNEKTPKAVSTSSPMYSSSSWELGDLIRDGKLDFDAVSDILGLSLPDITPATPAARNRSLSDDSDATPSPYVARVDTSATSLLVRKCGGPLCAIPEETDDLSEDIGEAGGPMGMRRPLSSLVERWGRACARESVDSARVAVPGDGKGAGRVRESVSSSILNVDISLLGLDVSAITPGVPQEVRADESDEGVEIWEEDGSWRENSSARNSIGWAR